MRRWAAALVLGALALAGCGGPPGDSARHVAPFQGLEVAGGVHVVVVRGATSGVSVHGRADVIDRVRTQSSGGLLRISVHDRGIVIGHDPMNDVRVRVTAPRLRDVRIKGSGNVDLGDVATRSLHFSITGAGDVTARGTVRSLTAIIHGAGGADFSKLATRTARVEVHGAAGVSLDVSDRLDVELHGAGEVRYRGNPTVTQDVRGAGNVTRDLP